MSEDSGIEIKAGWTIWISVLLTPLLIISLLYLVFWPEALLTDIANEKRGMAPVFARLMLSLPIWINSLFGGWGVAVFILVWWRALGLVKARGDPYILDKQGITVKRFRFATQYSWSDMESVVLNLREPNLRLKIRLKNEYPHNFASLLKYITFSRAVPTLYGPMLRKQKHEIEELLRKYAPSDLLKVR